MGLSASNDPGDRCLAPSAAAEALRERQILVRLLQNVEPGTAVDLADRLIERFGSLRAVLSADPNTRRQLLAGNEAAAEQLKTVQEAIYQATLSVARQDPLFPNTLAIADYLMARLADESSEQVRAFYLNTRFMLIREECVTRGSVNQAVVYPREILRRALELGAAAFIIAHNHASGDLEISDADREVTRRVLSAGKAVDVALLDHIIVSRRGCRSMRAEGFFK
jgi:DNA repair protein RadC